VLLQDRLTLGKQRLDDALDALVLLCEPVEPPKGELEHIHYFCGNTEVAADLQEREPRRAMLYKATVGLIRAYANIADELERAGYSASQAAHIKTQVDQYLSVREIVRKASGESLDLKAYEADMRHLIDTYIEADEPRTISPFGNLPLLELIVKSGIAAALASLPAGVRTNEAVTAEVIENNVRKTIIKEQLTDPAFYDRMSKLLDEIIAARKAKAIEYEEYLKRIAELAKKVQAGQDAETPPDLNTPGRRAIFNWLKAWTPEAAAEPGPGADPLDRALKLDAAIKRERSDGWRGVLAREQEIKRAMYNVLGQEAAVEALFPIIKQQREY